MATAHPSVDVTGTLVEYVTSARFSDLSPEVRHEAHRAFLNILGCALGGARGEAVETAARALLEFSGPREATLIGRGQMGDVFLATLLNCMSSNIRAFDDSHADTIIHPTGPVAFGILALAERNGVGGQAFVVAMLMGIEVACRLSKAVSAPPARGNIAWSQTGICCGAGSAVAASRILGLDQRQTRWALGIALDQASSFRVMHGTMTSPLAHAHAAHVGLRAAILARSGFTSAQHPIEGKFGFASVFAEEANLSALTDGLGSRYEALANGCKPFPCGIVIHPALDGCLQLKAKHAFGPHDVAAVRLRINASAFALAHRRHPRDELEAQTSLHHWIAAALTFGKAGVEEGTVEKLRNPVIQALTSVIEAEAGAELASDAADVTITLKDGRVLAIRIDHAIGSPARPMTDVEVERKFRTQAATVIGPDRIEKLVQHCWNLASVDDVGDLAKAAA